MVRTEVRTATVKGWVRDREGSDEREKEEREEREAGAHRPASEPMRERTSGLRQRACAAAWTRKGSEPKSRNEATVAAAEQGRLTKCNEMARNFEIEDIWTIGTKEERRGHHL